MCVCLGWSAAGAHALPKVAGSRIFRSQSPLSPAVIMEFSAAERTSGWHAKPGPDHWAGLRSTLTPPDLPLPVSSHPPPGLSAARALSETRPAEEDLSRAPFCGWRSSPHPPAKLRGAEAGGQERRGRSRLRFTCSDPGEPVGFPLSH